MSYSINELNKGVSLLCVESNTPKTSSLLVSFVLPLNEVNATYTALISKILLSGSKHHTSMKLLSQACDDNYGATLDSFVQKTGETIALSFVLSVLKNEYALNGEDILSDGIKLMSEVILEPYIVYGGFSKEYFLREKALQKEQILAVKNNKRSYAVHRGISEMFKGEAYAVPSIGTENVLEQTDEKCLAEFYFNVLKTAPIKIIFAGSCKEDNLIMSLKNYFPFDERDDAIPDTLVKSDVTEVREFSETASADQTTLFMGLRLHGDLCGNDYTALTVFGDIFSSSPISKLFMNVREKQQLCYYCSSSCERKKGFMLVTSGVDCKNTEKAKKAILNELSDIQNGKVSKEEFDSAVKASVSAYKALFDDSQIYSYYLIKMLQGKIVAPEDEIENLKKVTLQQVVEVAKSIVLDTVFVLKGEIR